MSTNEQEILDNVIRTFVRDQQISGHIQSTYHAQKLITLGWNAAKQHARAERDAGEPRLSILKDLLRELLSTAYITTGAVPTMAELGFATLSLKGVITEENLLRVFERHGIVPDWYELSEHLTDADEMVQPDHIPDITEMVQQRRKGYQESDYWRENCLTCGHLRCDHDDDEQQYCNLAPCDCPKFVEGETSGKHTPSDEAEG